METVQSHPVPIPALLPNVYPLSYCIPDECIADDVPEKKAVIAEVIPGKRQTYRFGPDDEELYDRMYAESRFAFTEKKGGWDCLRHYEILAVGCVPIFEHLDACPAATMTTFPKALVRRAEAELLPWLVPKECSEDRYDAVVRELLDHTRRHCSVSSVARRVLSTFGFANGNPSILLLPGHPGVNYSREFLWIGLAREISRRGGRAVCFPEMEYLYEDYAVAGCRSLHGLGFKYSRRLSPGLRTRCDESEVVRMIRAKAFDIVLFGKVGPDEGSTGTLPHLPLWEHVSAHYGPDSIGFIYGGDGCQDMASNNRYAQHLRAHAPFARCFVRELNAPGVAS